MNGCSQYPVLLVLGAGLSRRFGEADKLNAPLHGRPLAHHILETLDPLPWAHRRLVCRNTQSWQTAFHQAGFECLVNDSPGRGLGSSLALGMAGLSEDVRVFICLADMPMIDVAHVTALIAASRLHPEEVIASAGADYRGPPAIVPRTLLETIDPNSDRGARHLMQAACPVFCDIQKLCDIDDRQTLARLNAIPDNDDLRTSSEPSSHAACLTPYRRPR